MKLINAEKVYKGFLSIIKLTWESREGVTYTREVMSRESEINSSDSVAALAFKIEDGKPFFYFVRQNRSTLYDKKVKELVEVVCGTLELEEDPLECIKREVIEEIGYEVRETDFVRAYYTSPGCTTERAFLYVVELGDKIGRAHV